MALQIEELLRNARNVQILKLLRDDPRMNVSEIARKIGMSAPAVRDRIQRLEDAGVIKGYRLEIDPTALGYPISAFVRIRPLPGTISKIAALAQRLPQITECYRITGEDCFILKVHLDKLDNLNIILDQFLAFGLTTTSLVQSAAFLPRPLPLPGERVSKSGH